MQSFWRKVVVASLLVCCVACEASGSVKGGGSDNGSYGRLKVGVPF